MLEFEVKDQVEGLKLSPYSDGGEYGFLVLEDTLYSGIRKLHRLYLALVTHRPTSSRILMIFRRKETCWVIHSEISIVGAVNNSDGCRPFPKSVSVKDVNGVREYLSLFNFDASMANLVFSHGSAELE